jgi:hypothetical protein
VEDADEVGDVCLEVDPGAAEVDPVPDAGQRDRVGLVPRGAEQRDEALLEPAAAHSAGHQDERCHMPSRVSGDAAVAQSLPYRWKRTDQSPSIGPRNPMQMSEQARCSSPWSRSARRS